MHWRHSDDVWRGFYFNGSILKRNNSGRSFALSSNSAAGAAALSVIAISVLDHARGPTRSPLWGRVADVG
jgi:hypothetical protein